MRPPVSGAVQVPSVQPKKQKSLAPILLPSSVMRPRDPRREAILRGAELLCGNPNIYRADGERRMFRVPIKRPMSLVLREVAAEDLLSSRNSILDLTPLELASEALRLREELEAALRRVEDLETPLLLAKLLARAEAQKAEDERLEAAGPN